MKKDIVIIGGGPAGIITALAAKSVYPEKSVCLVKEIGDGVIPCAIPYMIHTMTDPEQNIMGNGPMESAGIEIRVGKVAAVDAEKSFAILSSGEKIAYQRLIMATGMLPFKPPIPGIDKAGVFVIEKSLSMMTRLREAASGAKHVVILGGGFIGAEFADELARETDVEVHVVELLPNLLHFAFDEEYTGQIRKELEAAGVKVHTEAKAVSINGGEHVTSVSLHGGNEIPADMVIIGIGGKPNVELARSAGLRITDGGSIWVDSYMRTTHDTIFAVGDCALKRDFFTRKEVPVWLASTATAEARIAGTNLSESAFCGKFRGLWQPSRPRSAGWHSEVPASPRETAAQRDSVSWRGAELRRTGIREPCPDLPDYP